MIKRFYFANISNLVFCIQICKRLSTSCITVTENVTSLFALNRYTSIYIYIFFRVGGGGEAAGRLFTLDAHLERNPVK